MNFTKKLSLLATVVFLLANTSGCGDGMSGKIAKLTKDHVRKVALMYTVYSQAHKFQGPSSEEELKTWLMEDPKAGDRLRRFGVEINDFDSIMTSNRTGERLEIRWGVKTRPMAPPYPVAFETTGVDGTRLIGMANGPMIEVDNDEDYEMLKKGKVPEAYQ